MTTHAEAIEKIVSTGGVTRSSVVAVLAAIHEAGFAVVPYACQPIILAHGWAAINAGRSQPVDMAPGPALLEAWPEMVKAADLARPPKDEE